MVQDRGHVGDQRGLGELPRGQVHAHREVLRGREAPLPVAQLVARRLEDPAPDRQDQPCLLRHGDEREWRHEAARRVGPAQESLHAQDLARQQVHQRLVVEPQLRPLDRPPQVVLQGDPVQRLDVHLGIEQHDLADRVGLRAVEGDLGLLEEVEGVVEGGAPDRDAHAGTHADVVAVKVERAGERPLDARRDPLRLADAAHGPQQDSELVGAETGDRVRGAGGRKQPLPHLGQQLVAGAVAEALVHHLEPVEVEQDQCHAALGRAPPAPLARRALHLLGEAVEQHRPVGQPGERVVERGVGTAADLRLGTLEQTGVVEGDGRQLAEPGQRLHLAHGEGPRGVARREADEPQHLVARGQRHGADRAEGLRRQVRGP